MVTKTRKKRHVARGRRSDSLALPKRSATRPAKLQWTRLERDPYERHLALEVRYDFSIKQAAKRLELRKELFELLPTAVTPKAMWHSVALFFNLEPGDQPGGYANTAVAKARNWLDEGADPASPGISEFMCRYWHALSYGKLAFGVDTPRAENGDPLVPTVAAPGGNVGDWTGLIKACLDANAEPIWAAAGGLMKDGKRWIPSVVLVQNYPTGASAHFGSFERTVAGEKYLIGDRTHIGYSLSWIDPATYSLTWGDFAGSTTKLRRFWGTLCHEYAHNFLEFGDLYGPPGCTGYWDLLGDNSPPGRMSEVSSYIKQRVGWLEYKAELEGPILESQELSLAPYTKTGEAYKVVPDPVHNPREYFLLEFRKKIGDDPWRPDGALPEEGLLITHINDRLGIPGVWLMRDAPFFDEELADHSDNGGTQWIGHEKMHGVLFPQGYRKHFTRWTQPSSDFYGGRPSGLAISDIRVVGGKCKFRIEIKGQPKVAWTTKAEDRAVAGRFTPESITGGQEVFLRDDDNAALLVHRQGQWLAAKKHVGWIGGWNLGKKDYEVVADLDGDGQDELYLRSPNWAGVLKWHINGFKTLTVQYDRIDDWNLGPDNHELAGDFDGDGKQEIFIRSPEWAGMLKLDGTALRLESIQHDVIDSWNLGPKDREYIGRFTTGDADEILIRSAEWIGLLYWHPGQKRFRLRKLQHDWVDGWNLGEKDRHTIGDFDGDGLDEVYIRSDKWAGLLKWKAGRFQLEWIVKDKLEHITGDTSGKLTLAKGDRSFGGRFLPSRDGVLHRNAKGVAVLTWEAGEMVVRHHLKSPFGNRWVLGSADRFVLGDFHRIGRDVALPELDYVQDGLTDVFIHNSWGSGTIGVNHAHWKPSKPDELVEEIGLTWINPSEILFDE